MHQLQTDDFSAALRPFQPYIKCLHDRSALQLARLTHSPLFLTQLCDADVYLTQVQCQSLWNTDVRNSHTCVMFAVKAHIVPVVPVPVVPEVPGR